MSTQASLFDQPQFVPGAARRTDPDTSKEAAQSINAGTLEHEVWNWLLSHGPAILDEICAALHLDKVTASPRLKPLEEAGCVVRTGIKRPGKTGRPQTEWKGIPQCK